MRWHRLAFIFWLLPDTPLKRRLLRIVGHRIHPEGSAGPNLVWRVRTFEVAGGASVGLFNVLKNLETVVLGKDCSLGRFNLISAHPVFASVLPQAGTLVLGEGSYATSRHTLDCSGGILVGSFSAIAGHGSILLTHSIDFDLDAQVAESISIGDRTFLSTHVRVLPGVHVGHRSLVAAGAVIPSRRTCEDGAIMAGIPARKVANTSGLWFQHPSSSTRDVVDLLKSKRYRNAF